MVPLAWALAPLIVALLPAKYAYLKVKFNRMMFYNFWVGFLNETQLFLAVCAGLNLLYLNWQNYGDIVNSSITVISGCVIVIFPIFVAIFYNIS